MPIHLSETQQSRKPVLNEAMRTSAGLDERRKKLLFRAWHRGMREMDHVLGTFANVALEDMADDELAEFESLMQAPDPDMYKWLSGSVPMPSNWDTPLVRRIRSFHLDG